MWIRTTSSWQSGVIHLGDAVRWYVPEDGERALAREVAPKSVDVDPEHVRAGGLGRQRPARVAHRALRGGVVLRIGAVEGESWHRP